MKTLSLNTRVELLEMEVAALRSVLSEWDEDKNCYGQFIKANVIREIFNVVAEYPTDMKGGER